MNVDQLATISLQAGLALMWVPLYLFLGIYYLVFHFRNRGGLDLLVACLWLCWATYTCGAVGLYTAATPAEGITWQRYQMLGAIFTMPTLLVFMLRFAGRRPGRAVLAVLAGTGVLFAGLDLFTPWFFSDQPAVKTVAALGMTFRYFEGVTGWIGDLCIAYGLALLLLSLAVGVGAWRRQVPRARSLVIGLLVILGAALNDSLVVLGVYEFLYLNEHAFAVFAFAAVYFMQDRFRAARQEAEAKSRALLAANQELATLDALKSTLLSNISHELGTPLVSIRGYAELILTGDLGPITARQADGLRVALRNVQRLQKLIGNLVGYAKLSDGQIEPSLERLDLRAVLADALATAAPQIEVQGQTLTQDLGAAAHWVEADPEMLGQVFDNLLSNALKFNRAGGEIQVTAAAGPDGTVRAVVADSGIGIAAEDQARIFDRFYQADSGDTRRFGGTGIGLAIVQEIVRLHQGTVQVESAPGEGARFIVALPAAEETD